MHNAAVKRVFKTRPHIVILGAGPAGLGAAFRLTRRGLAQVTVVERNNWVGGNAGSFELAGFRVDYGSHRLHPSCDLEVLRDIRALLGDDFLDRPRHGRIRLCNRWIHFPLKPFDLALRLPPKFSAGVAIDLVGKAFGNGDGFDHEETFASVLERGLGRAICRDFYFPYVEKIWGVEPEELSVTLARRRVSANSLAKMAQKIFAMLPRHKTNGRGRFSETYWRAACEAGAEVYLNSRVQSVEVEAGAIKALHYERDNQIFALAADHVWSTIPVTILAKSMRPTVPAMILHAADRIDYRAMILIYLVLEQERFSEYDAHYFPEARIPIARLSEPKNYNNGQGPKNLTVLCAELPCASDGPEWSKSDEELGVLTCNALEASGIPVRAPITKIVTRRLRQAYPIYRRGYEDYFKPLDEWLAGIEGLLTFGRQGLFAHDNTHHALYMAYSAVECLDGNGCFNRERWQSFRRVFETHVVED
jgi:protoporphyrinogen oxidase